MKRNDVIRWAEESGALLLEGMQVDVLMRFAERVAAAERQRCATIAETAEPYQSADLIREAFDTRIEPWHMNLPGCKGACQQGRRPCLHPEQCWPDLPSRSGCLIVVTGSILLWSIIIGILWLVVDL